MDEYELACGVLAGDAEPPAGAPEALGLVRRVLGRADPPATEVLAALTVLRHAREETAVWESRLIASARAGGASWAELAPALGVASRQAAERRYLRLRPSVTGEATGEGRVRAERDRRAGDRAVHEWARDNAAVLRRLAGRVGGADGLPAAARERTDRALSDDDPATLLPPLADAYSHLELRHAVLAAEVLAVTEHIERLRRDTHDRRQR